MFNDTFRWIAMVSLLTCFPLWGLLFLYMRYRDNENYEMNAIRKEAIDEKVRRRTREMSQAESFQQQ